MLVPTAGRPAAEVIAGPGKDAQWEGREGRRKQGNSHDCDSVQTFPDEPEKAEIKTNKNETPGQPRKLSGLGVRSADGWSRISRQSHRKGPRRGICLKSV